MILLLFIVIFCVIWISEIATLYISEGKYFSNVKNIHEKQVGLLLGTSKILPDGRHNLFYIYRINATVELYKAGKIQQILISGDNGKSDYDEPTDMKNDLIKAGIPEKNITLDFAGFRTLDSIVRAKEIFWVENMIIISQKFHIIRGIVLAHFYGIDAIWYEAQAVPLKLSPRIFVRERLARVKMWLDIFFGKQPKFLGKKEELNSTLFPIKDVAVIEVDLEKQSVDFWGIQTTQKHYDTQKANLIFQRFFAKDFLKNIWDSKVQFVINGQFFDQNKTPTLLSFPLKSKGKIISSYMDNTLPKKTLIIDENNQVHIKNDFQPQWLENPKNPDIIVGFSPKVDANLALSLPRTYVGKRDKKHLVFVIAKAKTGKEMQKIMNDLHITNYMMFDGWPSSHFAWNHNGNIKQFLWFWEVPHFFVIRKK